MFRTFELPEVSTTGRSPRGSGIYFQACQYVDSRDAVKDYDGKIYPVKHILAIDTGDAWLPRFDLVLLYQKYKFFPYEHFSSDFLLPSMPFVLGVARSRVGRLGLRRSGLT
jgi:hypothetical protein